MSEETPAPVTNEKRNAQLAVAREKAVEAIKRKALAKEEKRIEAAKQRLIEQGIAIAPQTKDPVAKQAKWDARKMEIVNEVHERMKSLGIPHRNDSRKKAKKRVKVESPPTSDSETEDDSDATEESFEIKRIKKDKKSKNKAPKEPEQPQLLRLY
jgi:hypothetical protein